MTNLQQIKEEIKKKILSLIDYGVKDRYGVDMIHINDANELIDQIISRTTAHVLSEVNEVLESDEICEEFDMEEGVCNACPACKINKKLSDAQSAVNKIKE